MKEENKDFLVRSGIGYMFFFCNFIYLSIWGLLCLIKDHQILIWRLEKKWKKLVALSPAPTSEATPGVYPTTAPVAKVSTAPSAASPTTSTHAPASPVTASATTTTTSTAHVSSAAQVILKTGLILASSY